MQQLSAQSSQSGRHRRTRRLLAGVALATAGVGQAGAQEFVWNSTAPKFWDDGDGLDWINDIPGSPSPAPFGGQGAFAFINNGGTAIIRQSIFDIEDIIVGDTAFGGTSTLRHTAGSTKPLLGGTPGSMIIGRNGATGSYFMSGTALQAKDVMLIGTADDGNTPGGHGKLQMIGGSKFVGSQLGVGLGGAFNDRSSGEVLMYENASFQTSQWVHVNNGMMEMGGQANGFVGTGFWIGQGDGNSATLNLAGASNIEVNGNIRLARDNSTGTINLGGNARLARVGNDSGYIGMGSLGSTGSAQINIFDEARLESTTNLVMAESGRQSIVNQTGGFVELWDNPGQSTLKDALEIDPSGDDLGEYNLAGGTLKVQSINATTGQFNFTGGRLMVNGSYRGDLLQSGGVFAPGASPGEVTIEGDYDLNADEEAGVLEIELGGTVPGSEHDKLIVVGNVNLTSGMLHVLLYEDYEPDMGDSFDFMDWGGSLSGEFDALDLPSLGPGKTWDTTDLLTAGELTVILPGDTDGDGDVDDSDLGTAFANYTGPVGAAGGKTAIHGDFDYDGDVDDSDLGAAFSNYTGPTAQANVPEPTSLLLLMSGLLAVTRRRR